MNNLLTNRRYVVKEDVSGNHVSWYSPERFLASYKSVVDSGLWNTSSSAGDWEGWILQKLNNRFYLIMFSQTNLNWGNSYELMTGGVLTDFEGGQPSEAEIWDTISFYEDMMN